MEEFEVATGARSASRDKLCQRDEASVAMLIAMAMPLIEPGRITVTWCAIIFSRKSAWD